MSKNKKLYKIGDITKKLNITPRTIRYYDQLGLLPNIKRSDGDTRLFDSSDISLIEKTRQYQKNNLLPLFEIKSKLFPTLLTKYKVCLLTDTLSQKKYNLPKTTNLNIENLNSISSFNKTLNELLNRNSKNTIFIYFYDTEHKAFFEKISSSINPNQKIKFYPILKHGFSTHMIINYIIKNTNIITTLEELDLLIAQLINLSFNIGILDTINHFFPNPPKKSSEITNKISSFRPIFFSTNNFIEIKSHNPNETSLISILIEEFEIELLKQKRYIKQVEIFSLNNIELAKETKEKLEKKHSKIKTKITECSKWPFNGEKGIIITLI
mgnify:CR=1 FL=1|jgi:hypothetical protein